VFPIVITFLPVVITAKAREPLLGVKKNIIMCAMYKAPFFVHAILGVSFYSHTLKLRSALRIIRLKRFTLKWKHLLWIPTHSSLLFVRRLCFPAVRM